MKIYLNKRWQPRHFHITKGGKQSVPVPPVPPTKRPRATHVLGKGEDMFKIMTKADKILIFFILVSSIASIFAIPRLLTSANSEKQVVVNVAGEEIARFALINTPESEFKEVPFKVNEKEYTARFEMKNGKVMLHRLPEDIVPLSIHKDMGWISESYQMIVALPVKMYVVVESDTPSENEDSDIDIIVY